MSAEYSVILVPPEGDPLGLLHIGPCGFRPPTAERWACIVDGCGNEWWNFGRGVPRCPGCTRAASVRGRGAALVLGYRGEALDVGIDIAERSGSFRRIAACSGVRDWMAGDFTHGLAAGGGATAIVIDEHGHAVERVAT